MYVYAEISESGNSICISYHMYKYKYMYLYNTIRITDIGRYTNGGSFGFKSNVNMCRNG